VRNASDDDSEWYQPTDELKEDCASPFDDAQRIQHGFASDDEEVNTQLSTNSPVLELPTTDQPTPSYAIDHNDDILEISPDIEIDIADAELTSELTMDC